MLSRVAVGRGIQQARLPAFIDFMRCVDRVQQTKEYPLLPFLPAEKFYFSLRPSSPTLMGSVLPAGSDASSDSRPAFVSVLSLERYIFKTFSEWNWSYTFVLFLTTFFMKDNNLFHAIVATLQSFCGHFFNSSIILSLSFKFLKIW